MSSSSARTHHAVIMKEGGGIAKKHDFKWKKDGMEGSSPKGSEREREQ